MKQSKRNGRVGDGEQELKWNHRPWQREREEEMCSREVVEWVMQTALKPTRGLGEGEGDERGSC